MNINRIGSREEWLSKRKKLLVLEKAHSKAREALTAQRMAMPWVVVEKDYVFNGPDGRVALGELFGKKSQLLVHHFMFQPEWESGCKHCSFMADHIDPIQVHLAQRDLAFAAISIAPFEQIAAFRQRMGWSFPWFSSKGGTFNEDFAVTMTEEATSEGTAHYNFREYGGGPCELPGVSVFAKDSENAIFHTYSCYARGLENMIGTYNYLDLIPKGRDENSLPYGMAWLCLKDQY